MALYLFSLLMVTTHAFHLRHSHQTIFITQSHLSLLHLIFGTSFLHHSEFLIRIIHPLSVTFIRTCQSHFRHTFHHFFIVSLLAQNLTFQKILSSTLVCFCLSDCSHGPRLFRYRIYLLIGFYVLISFISVLVNSHVRQTKSASSLVNF